MTVKDCLQSFHKIRYLVYADGFLPNTRILVETYKPDAERPNGNSFFTDSSGSWSFVGGYHSSLGVMNGTYRLVAYNVDSNINQLPNSPYAEAEVDAPCPIISTPPNTEVSASINNNLIQSGDSVSSTSIRFAYSIHDHFAPYAQFECKLDDQSYQDCTIERCEIPGHCIPNSLEYGERDYIDLEPGLHKFLVRAIDDANNIDPTPAEFTWTIVKPTADAGPNQLVHSNDIVKLNGDNSSDINRSPLIFTWNQTLGPKIVLSDSTTSNPTFAAPEVNEQTVLVFQLTVTNEEGIVSEPDEVIITVNPVANPPVNQEPKTISELLRDIIQNPLDIANSIDSANQIKNILTDNNRHNDQLVCDLINSEDESTSGIREILNC